MKTVEEYLNYGFETYSSTGEVISKVKGPGYLSDWLADWRQAPEQLAIIPVSYEKFTQTASKSRCWRTVMIPVDAQYNEIPGERIEAVIYVAENETEARTLARQYGCDVYYWCYWEETRLIIVISSQNEIDYPESDDWTIYTANDL